MLGWYIYLIHDFVMPLPQHTRSSSINQLTKQLPGIQPAYPPCIPTLPKHSSEARACTRATGWAPPIWYSELLHSTEYQLVANPLDWDYIIQWDWMDQPIALFGGTSWRTFHLKRLTNLELRCSARSAGSTRDSAGARWLGLLGVSSSVLCRQLTSQRLLLATLSSTGRC